MTDNFVYRVKGNSNAFPNNLGRRKEGQRELRGGEEEEEEGRGWARSGRAMDTN